MCKHPLRAASSWTMAGRSVTSRTSHWWVLPQNRCECICFADALQTVAGFAFVQWCVLRAMCCALQGGGAVNMGLDDFKGSGSCSTVRPNATTVTFNGSTVFAGNTAKLQGGAIALQSGSLLLQVCV